VVNLTGGHGSIHHVELWVPDLGRAAETLGWLLETLGYAVYQDWPGGRSWILGQTYLVVEESPAMAADVHNRMLPGLNHLAFHAGERDRVEQIVNESLQRGWTLLFADRHPFAGGTDHYAAYLVNVDGFEVELVAAKV
jgi:catechol 2,3-dioxygenase-like lactoylglutathione lyase family enzyme